MSQSGFTRRSILATGTAGLALAQAAKSETYQSDPKLPPDETDRPTAADPLHGYVFFSATEAAFVEAALARLIPEDELGPGAVEAGVAVFIDRQLAGPYGQGDHFYLKGPFPKAEPTQGWQASKPAEVYRQAMVAVERYVKDSAGASFAQLSPEKQDTVLKALESGDAKLKGGADAKVFFALLLQNTMEGFFADPLYGGNRDMAGWKLIGFPGARYNNRPYVLRHGERYPLPPVAIGGRPDWSRS